MGSRLILACAVALILASCGGGSASLTQNPPTGPQTQPPALTAPNIYDRSQATTAYGGSTDARNLASNPPANTDATGQFVLVGTPDMQIAADQLGPRLRGWHGRTEMAHGRVRDGVSAAELVSYLRADAAFRGINLVKRWGSTPPTIRMAARSTDDDWFDTQNAVRLINSVLPPDWQLRFDNRETVYNGLLTRGYIDVAFVPRERWPRGGCENAIGCAWSDYTRNGQMTAGLALVDPIRVTGERKRVFVLLHELLHTLGRGHVSPYAFPDTIMHAAGDMGISDWLILSPLDEAALYAVHARLRPGTSGNLDFRDLGPWSEASTHVMGRLDRVSGRQQAIVFGAVWQNGLVRPYAMGLNPSPPLQRRLSGSALWSGRIFGLTPQAEAVAGAVDMTVQLASLHGELDFTGLEKWAPHARPGALGTGARWGDGDLHYALSLIDGQVFVEAGGDEGEITGVFFGSRHERMGGTLRRRDLSAGFGGTRR